MFGVCGLLAGASASWGLGASSPAAAAARQEEGAAEPEQSALPAWVLDLESKPDEALMQWAGDLERVSARYRTEARLVPTFERLLDFALAAEGDQVDTAAACAVRGLARLDRADCVAVRRRRIAARRDLSETLMVADRVIQDHAARQVEKKDK